MPDIARTCRGPVGRQSIRSCRKSCASEVRHFAAICAGPSMSDVWRDLATITESEHGLRAAESPSSYACHR